jgi:hypothetical protein
MFSKMTIDTKKSGNIMLGSCGGRMKKTACGIGNLGLGLMFPAFWSTLRSLNCPETTPIVQMQGCGSKNFLHQQSM